MDEDINVINNSTRNEKIKEFLIFNKKKIIFFLVSFLVILVFFFGYNEYKNKKKKNISDFYNSTIIEYSKDNIKKTVQDLIEIVKRKDSTYSPLSLYFIIDNDLISNKNEINDLFDIIINKTSLDPEIKNLVIYKKSLYNADQIGENELINLLNPIINSKSIWKSHALYLLAEYFYSKNEKQKSKEFFSQIVSLENANSDLKRESQKRLNRDLSD
jgi:predicted negative regulator of RcsB-dependent stress response